VKALQRVAAIGLLAAAAVKMGAGSAAWLGGFVDPSRYPGAFSPWVHAVHVAVFGGAGLLLLLGSRTDVRVRHLGMLFLLLAASFSDRLIAAVASTASGSMVGATATFLTALQPEAFIPFVAWRFVSEFPRVEASERLRHAFLSGTVASLAIGLVLLVTNLALAPLRGIFPALAALLQPFGREPREASAFWQILIVLILPAFFLMLRKIPMSARAERRRVGMFVTGLVGGAAPMMILVVVEGLLSPVSSFMNEPARRHWSGVICYSLLLSVPFSTGYAVLVGRVMDVRLVLRKALRYGLARLTVLVALALPTFGVVFAIYERRDRTIAELLVGRSAVALAGATLLCVALFRARRPLFNALDRHFFRDQHDARELLAGIADRARAASTPADFASFVESQIDGALHVERITFLVADPATSVLTSPLGRVEPLALSGTLVTLLSGDTTPLDLELADARSTMRRLSAVERDWLTRNNVRMLVPLVGTGGGLVGAVALGPRKSEQSFSDSDRLLLSAAGAAAALALENWALRSGRSSEEDTHTSDPIIGSPSEAPLARRCEVCGLVHPPEAARCRECGGNLVAAMLPERVKDKFQVQRLIGSGGMGVVYLARDDGLRRFVALKTMLNLSDSHARRLRREARAMASLQHSHLATIYGLEKWRDVPILVVEYFPRGTLADRLRLGPLSAIEVCRLGYELAQALEYLHAHKLLHRDVKPSNVGLTRDGVPKLLDFGLAKVVDPDLHSLSTRGDDSTGTARSGSQDETRSSVVVGTIAYLPPEAFQPQPPSPAFDLWGLSVTLYEALTGVHPFKRPSVYETINTILTREVPDALELRPDCPKALSELLSDCLRIDSRRRPASAAIVSSRLDALLHEAADHGLRWRSPRGTPRDRA
jgi:protein kinase-like protein